MKKIIAITIGALCLAGVAFASGKKESPTPTHPEALRVAAITGTSGIGMAYLFSNVPDLGDGTAVSFESVGAADALVPKLLSGEIDITVLPPNLAAKLYNVNPNSVVMGAVVGNGMISLVTRDSGVSTVADLRGKTVSVAGQGATPEYALRALLAKTGINAGDTTLDFSIPNPEIAAALVAGKIEYALVPEPFATIAVLNGGGAAPIRRAFAVKDEWKKAGFGEDFPMTVCVIRKEYAEAYPDTVRSFLDSYRASIEWTVAHPAEAGAYVESAGLGLKSPIVAKAIPSANFVYVPATDARSDMESLLKVYLQFAPEAIGGKLPDSGFYFR